MEVVVRLYGGLGGAQGEVRRLRLTPGAAVKELLAELAVPIQDVKLVFVNGRRVAWEYGLSEGDEVGIFPPIAGG